MRKMFFLGALASVIALSSCDKEKVSSPLSRDMSKTSTVRVYLKAETNLAQGGNELVAAGTKVVFTVQNSEYSYAGSGASAQGAWTSTATINSNGYAEVSVPSDADGVNLAISPAEFEFDQVQIEGSPIATLKKTYNIATQYISVISGEIKILEYNYNTPNVINEEMPFTATISGVIYAELNNTQAGFEKMPLGSKVEVKNTSGTWSKIITTDANGAYTTTVPVDANGENFQVVALTFTYDQVQPLYTTGTATKKMEYAAASAFANNVIPNDTRFLNVTYAAPTEVGANPEIEFVEIAGIIKANLNTETAELETFAAGTKFIFSTTNWSTEITISSTGEYSVSVPKDVRVYNNCDFEIQRRVLDAASGNYVSKTYRCYIELEAIGQFDYENGLVNFNIDDSAFTLVNPVN